MKATELHARLGGTLHTLSTASWALHVSRWRPSTPARFDAEWESHPAERREVVVFNRRCYENRYSRAFGDVAYAYAGKSPRRRRSRRIRPAASSWRRATLLSMRT